MIRGGCFKGKRCGLKSAEVEGLDESEFLSG